MKAILVPTEDAGSIQSALHTSLLLAKRTGGYIEGFPLRAGISEFVALEPGGVIPLDSFRQDSVDEALRARQLFEAFMAANHVARGTKTDGGPSYGWLDDAPEGDGFVGSYGRVFDVIVLSRPDDKSTAVHDRAIETALFESGRPVLLTPPSAPTQIATNIMIHWNGSTEQARANAFAMPLLRQAERVTVLTVVGGQGVPGPTAEQLLQYLNYNAVAARPMSVGLEGRSTGEAILAVAKAEGCDLLVKGAFTQSRLRQMIFGGATSYVLAHADLPVLMAH